MATADQARAYRAAHLDRVREYDRRRAAANPEIYRERARQRYANKTAEIIEQARERRVSNRIAVLDHYGRACACCGSTDRLCIDHVDGRGREHRAAIGTHSGTQFYAWLMRTGLPDGFQTLCLRCNNSKGNGSACRLRHLQEV